MPESAYQLSHGIFRCRRGYSLRTVAISPTGPDPPVAVLFMCHGFSVHCMKNETVLGQMAAEARVLLYTYDCHGHGASEPSDEKLSAYVNDPQDLVDDLVDYTHHVLSELKESAQRAKETGAPQADPQHVLLQPAVAGQATAATEGAKQGAAAREGTLATAQAAAAASVPAMVEAADVPAAASAEQQAEDAGKTAAATSHAAAQYAGGNLSSVANGGPAVAVGSGGVTGAGSLATALRRVFVGGESMGGMTAALAVVQQPTLYHGLVLCSALTELGGPPGKRTWSGVLREKALLLLDMVAPHYAPVGRRPIESGMRIHDGIEDMYKDKLWYRGPIKVRTICSLARGCRMLTDGRAGITVPIFAQHGTADMTCSFGTIQRFLAAVGTPPEQRTLFVVDGGLHDLNRDPETQACVAALVKWLKAQVAMAVV